MSFLCGLRFIRKAVTFSPNMSSDRYIWMDLEMTGLNPEKDSILEVACLVSTSDLKPLDKGIDIVIHQSDEVLNNMNDWCKVHHAKSGLIKQCKASKINLQEAETQIANYIRSHVNEKDSGNNYIAGNSIYMDLMFIKKYLPSISNFFHYRLLDVSTLKILCKNWYPNDFVNITKTVDHRALSDIYSSIDELKTYKNLFFK